jgi:hypothetical protein
MSDMIVLRLEGEAGFLLVNRALGTVQPLDTEELPPDTSAAAADKFRGVAEAYALPALATLSSRKHYLS